MKYSGKNYHLYSRKFFFFFVNIVRELGHKGLIHRFYEMKHFS